MDWEAFRLTLREENIRIMDTMMTHRLEICLEQWYIQIENTLDEHCPKRKNRPLDLNNPWWTGKLQNQRKELKTIKKKSKSHPTPQNKELYKSSSDDELNWRHHISSQIEKCRNLMAIISANVRHNFGPKPKLVRWAYTGVVRPKLLYACQAWANKITAKQIKCMKRLDRQTTTAMAPIRRSTPQASMEIMFNITPIELLIEHMGAASFIRTRPHLQPFADTPNGHLKSWAKTVDNIEQGKETDIIENTTTLNRPYNVNIVSLTNDTKNYIRHSE